MIKKTKKERVENYLNQLMESDDFSIDNLLELTAEELLKAPTLSDIGKITISSVLSSYKQKYEEDFFQDLDDEVMAELGEPAVIEPQTTNVSDVFSPDEISDLKRMIRDKTYNSDAELIELKLALKNAGIDYLMILRDYRTQKEIELREWEDTLKE